MRVCLLAVLGTVLVACGGSKGGTIDGGSLDFGLVWLGDAHTLPLSVANTTSKSVHLSLTSGPAGFSLKDIDIAPGATASAELTFKPTAAGDSSGTAKLDFGQGRTLAVQVKGTGAHFDLTPDPTTIDFGTLVMGAPLFDEVELHNPGNQTVTLPLSLEQDAATSFLLNLDPPSIDLPAHGSAKVPVGFVPRGAGEVQGALLVGGCDSCGPLRIPLHGVGLALDVTVSSDALVFPPVDPSMTASLPLTIHNASTQDVNLDAISVTPSDGPFATDGMANTGIPAGGDLVITVSFTPVAQGNYTGHVVLFVNGKQFTVSLSGSSQPGLLAQPSMLQFGRVPVAVSFSSTVRLIDEGTSGVQVTAAAIDPPGSGFTAQATLPATVGPDPLDVTVTFRDESAGTVDAALVLTTSAGDFRVPLSATAVQSGDCTGLSIPASLRFGLVHQGSMAVRNLTVVNGGSDGCFLWDVGLEPAGSPRMTTTFARSTVVELAPGVSFDVPVTFAPVDEQRQVSTLSMRHAPEAAAPVAVPVSGEGTKLELNATPPSIDFGQVSTSGGVGILAIEIASDSSQVRLSDIHPSQATPASFHTLFGLDLPRTLPAGHHLPVFVVFRPDTEGSFGGDVEVALRGLDEPLLVPIRGQGISGDCGGSCTAPVPSCPASVDALVGLHASVLAASQGPGGASLDCAFTVENAPAGSTATIPPGDCKGTTFQPDVAGTYTLNYAATWAGPDGPATRSCHIPVHATNTPGLWVETTWDAALDLDLHVFHPQAGDPGQPATWTGTGLDAWAGNPSPAWDTAGTHDDPLMLADEDRAAGFELLRISEPTADAAYAVGVRWTDDLSLGSAVNTTTTIVCDSKVVASQANALATPKDAVVVGRVTSGAAGCTFTPDGTVVHVP